MSSRGPGRVPIWFTCLLAGLLCGCQGVGFLGKKFDPRSPADAAVEGTWTQAQVAGSIPEAWLKPSMEAFRLGPGDRLDIEILGERGSRAETFVTPDGKVYFNLLPGLSANGKTAAELKKDLEEGLKRYYRHPEVVVNLTQVSSQRVYLLGRVYNPGVIRLERPLTVLDAVSAGGGLYASRFTGTTEELADLDHSFVMRDGQVLPVNMKKLIQGGDLSQNIYLKPNDFIYLPSTLSNEVYILGAVMSPRPVGFLNEMNLMAALGHGLGTKPGADLTHVVVCRGTLVSPKATIVDMKAIMAGQVPNIRLQPGDIVYVPGERVISIKRLLQDTMETFVRVVSANEGARAAIPQPDNVNVNVNVGGNATGR